MLSVLIGLMAVLPGRQQTCDTIADTTRIQALGGKLLRSDQLRPDMRPAEDGVVLHLDRRQRELMIEADTYGDWRAGAGSMLRFRGPQW